MSLNTSQKGTPGILANQVAPDIKEERSKAMQDLGKLGFQNFAQKLVKFMRF